MTTKMQLDFSDVRTFSGLAHQVSDCFLAVECSHSGRGEFVDISMLDCQVAILENAIARYEATGQVPKPLGARHPSIAPFEAFRSADGYLIVAAGNDKLFAAVSCRDVACPNFGFDSLRELAENLVARSMAVSVGPGQTALTVIPSVATSWATLTVNATTAAFEAQ